MNDPGAIAALEKLWEFARGDLQPREFEQWFLEQEGLESLLGPDLHWNLTADDYRDAEVVWKLRGALAEALPPVANCYCHRFKNIDHVPMGGDVDEDEKFWSDRVFATFEIEVAHSSPQWWRNLQRCKSCETKWLVAQEERIFDEWLIARLSSGEFASAKCGHWPKRFETYYDVLVVGRKLVTPCIFLDSSDGSLVWTVEDLLREKPDIEGREIAHLLGVSERNADQLIMKARASHDQAGPRQGSSST